MSKILCPHCGENHIVSNKRIASLFSKIRTEKLTDSEKKEIGKRLLESRKKNK